MKRLCVIGSLNTDLVTMVDRFPRAGETVRGRDFGVFPGGKGGNQAVAAARLGAEVLFIGKVGDDQYGRDYRETLGRERVDVRGLATEVGTASGIAVIFIDRLGENTIVVAPGANAAVDTDFLDAQWNLIESCDLFLLQLEIPIESVAAACERLHGARKRVILDPAPPVPLPPGLLSGVDFITPNENELEALTGERGGEWDSAVAGARKLLDSGASTVILKRGGEGSAVVTPTAEKRVPGYTVDAVDTTAAGDSFNAALAVALSEGRDVEEAVAFANAVGALATTAVGAQSAMPSRAEAEAFIAGQRE